METKTPANESTNNKVVLYKPNMMNLTECIREFQLPQQFPSTAKEANSMKWKLKISDRMQLPMSTAKVVNSAKVLPFYHTKTMMPCKKIRIVTPNGKDLGEFKVELRNSQDSSTKGQVFTITKMNNGKLANKSAAISSSVSCTQRQTFPRILKPESIKMGKRKFLNVNTETKQMFNSSRSIQTLSNVPVTPPIQRVFPISYVSNILDLKPNKRIHNINNINLEKKSINENSEVSINHVANRDHRYVEMKNKLIILPNSSTCNVSNVKIQPKIAMSTAQDAQDKISSTAESVSFKNIAESPFPIVSCEKLRVKNNDNDHMQAFSNIWQEKYRDVQNIDNKITVTFLNNASDFARKCNMTDRHLTEQNTSSKERQYNEKVSGNISKYQIKSISIYGNKQTYEKKINIITNIPNNDTSFDKNVISRHDNAIPSTSNNNVVNINIRTARNNVNDTIHSSVESKRSRKELENDNDSSIIILETDDIADMQSKGRSKNHLENSSKDLLQQWDIIEKAVNSVNDEELRARALTALADCGIGVQKQMPIPPPEKLKAVHDTQVQTMIFGLLDPKSFVLINKDTENIHRIGQVAFHDTPNAQNSSLKNDLYLSGNSEFDPVGTIGQGIDFNIDEFLRDFCKENLDAQQVKKTLSTTTARCEKIINQLQKDYESVKKYDEQGMLNIHNAVINNNINDVRRHLMILEQFKESVDILTENGEVSPSLLLY